MSEILPTVILFREGQSCERASSELCWAEGNLAGFHATSAGSLYGPVLADFAAAELYLGRTEEALTDMAACLQFGRDLSWVPSLFALEISLRCLDGGLGTCVLALRFPESAFTHMAELGRILDRLDAQFPSLHRALKGEVTMLFASAVQSVSGTFNPKPKRWHCWKYGFSVPTMVAELYDSANQAVDNAATWESLPWLEVAAKHGAFDASISKDVWRIGCKSPDTAELVSLHWRECRARLRILRALIQLRQGLTPDNPQWPVDPFTLKSLHHGRIKGRPAVWSEWKDGDDAGAGTWLPRGEHQDLVIDDEP